MTEKHTLRVFDEDLKALSDEVINLAARVAEELDGALSAMISGDTTAAQAVIDSDRQADALQDRINQHTTRTLARQQAMADDLRAILAAARIAPHLERIGDSVASNYSQRVDCAVVDSTAFVQKRMSRTSPVLLFFLHLWARAQQRLARDHQVHLFGNIGDMITGPLQPLSDEQLLRAILYHRAVLAHLPEKVLKNPGVDGVQLGIVGPGDVGRLRVVLRVGLDHAA